MLIMTSVYGTNRICFFQKALPEETGRGRGAAEAMESLQREDGAEEGLMVSNFQSTFGVWTLLVDLRLFEAEINLFLFCFFVVFFSDSAGFRAPGVKGPRSEA